MNIATYSLRMVKENTVNYDGRHGITNPEKAHQLAQTLGLDENAEEEFWLLCLDTKNKPCGLHMVSRGNLNSSIVHPREVFKRALLNNASSIMLYHNHPSGDPTPSHEDIEITRRLKEAGELLGIRVMDHIIIGDNGYQSMRERLEM